MNKRFYILLILTVLITFSCKNKSEVKFYSDEQWKLYSITLEDTLITGQEYDTYIKTKGSIVGTLINNKIKWSRIDLSN